MARIFASAVGILSFLVAAFSSASANPIIIELAKGVAYGVGTQAGKEVFDRVIGGGSTSAPQPAPAPPVAPSSPPPSGGSSPPTTMIAPPTPPNGLILRVQNVSGDSITMQFYSTARRHIWPGDPTGLRAYLFANGVSGVIKLGCMPGEKICYGAWAQRKYWGAGFRMRYSCSDCCRICGSEARGVSLH